MNSVLKVLFGIQGVVSKRRISFFAAMLLAGCGINTNLLDIPLHQEIGIEQYDAKSTVSVKNDTYYGTNHIEYKILANSEQETLTVESVKKYCYPLSEYPFSDKSKSKKVLKTYKKSMEADLDEFVCLSADTDFGLFSAKKTSYKKSIDSANAEYRYYGKLDSKSRPNGTGVLLKNWGYDNYNDLSQGVYADIVYIGNFKDGYMSGYGILFDEVNGTKCVDYEGEFKKGLRDGKGIEYIGSVYDVSEILNMQYDEDDLMEVSKYFVEVSENSGLVVEPVAVSMKYYEGGFKEDQKSGKGVEYLGVDENSEPVKIYEGSFKNDRYSGKGTSYFDDGQVHYKGEFKNGVYNGKGTLYDESGKVVHKGKFKNGEVK